MIGKALIVIGLGIAAVGALMVFAEKIPFLGRLPGDIAIKRENFSFYFPVTTCIILSVILSLIMWLLRRR